MADLSWNRVEDPDSTLSSLGSHVGPAYAVRVQASAGPGAHPPQRGSAGLGSYAAAGSHGCSRLKAACSLVLFARVGGMVLGLRQFDMNGLLKSALMVLLFIVGVVLLSLCPEGFGVDCDHPCCTGAYRSRSLQGLVRRLRNPCLSAVGLLPHVARESSRTHGRYVLVPGFRSADSGGLSPENLIVRRHVPVVVNRVRRFLMSKKTILTVAVVAPIFILAVVVGAQAVKPKFDGDTITKTFSQGQPCATATIPLNLTAVLIRSMSRRTCLRHSGR